MVVGTSRNMLSGKVKLVSDNHGQVATVVSFCVRFLRRLRIVLTAMVLAIGAMVVTAGPASASATITIDEYGSLGTYPYGVLTVYGTATCSTPSGTATISVSALQFVMNYASGVGSTTIPCTSQPTAWEVTTTVLGCNPVISPNNCFMSNSYALTDVTLTRNGIQEANEYRQVYT